MKIFFISALFIGQFVATGTFAQQVSGESGNQAAQREAAKHAISGYFEIVRNNVQRGITEHINVNYTLSPLPIGNIFNLDLYTADPTLFRADIADSKGRVVQHWEPAAKSNHYLEGIDISALPAGNYVLNIYAEKNAALLHSVSFEKQSGDNQAHN